MCEPRRVGRGGEGFREKLSMWAGGGGEEVVRGEGESESVRERKEMAHSRDRKENPR